MDINEAYIRMVIVTDWNERRSVGNPSFDSDPLEDREGSEESRKVTTYKHRQ